MRQGEALAPERALRYDCAVYRIDPERLDQLPGYVGFIRKDHHGSHPALTKCPAEFLKGGGNELLKQVAAYVRKGPVHIIGGDVRLLRQSAHCPELLANPVGNVGAEVERSQVSVEDRKVGQLTMRRGQDKLELTRVASQAVLEDLDH